MALTFADTYNMLSNLTKSDASEGFDQIIDFLNASSIKAQVGDLSSHSAKYSSPVLIQKVFANMRRIEKGFFRVDTPLFEGMIVAQQDDDIADEGAANVVVDNVPAAVDEPTIPSPTPTTQPPPPSQDLPSTSQVQPTPPPSLIAQPPSPQQQPQPPQSSHDAKISMDLLHTLLETCTTLTRRGMIISSMDAYVDVTLKDVADITKEVVVDAEIKESADVQGRQAESQAQIYQIDLEHADKVLSMQDDEVEPTELQEVVEVVTTAKLITEVVTAASATITAAITPLTAAAITTTPSAARRRKGVVIRDPKETATQSIIIHSEPKSKDNSKGILIEEPKPLKKQAQIEQDEAFARELEAELNKTINWDDVIDQVQRKEKEDNDVMRYQALKRKPQTEAQARKNMMIYLRNIVGFKMDYFKGMTFDDIRLIFKKKFNSKKANKKQKLDEEVEELKRHLQIVSNDDDDVYTEATPLARKIPVVDYEIYTKNNKPYYKIIRADGSPQLFLSFLSLLRNFDREDLEVLWELVKERFASSKPKNFSDDFLLTTLTYMFEKPDVQA
nr:hypothetical protein [Tanacetum cinerariifolium]